MPKDRPLRATDLKENCSGLATENLQEKLFRQNDVIRDLNLKLAKAHNENEELRQQLALARMEVAALQARP